MALAQPIMALPSPKAMIQMKIKTQLILLTFCVLALALANVLSVGGTMHFNEQREEREQVVKRRLVQIRSAEEAYCRKHGVYTDRLDELVGGGLLADSLRKIPFSGGKSFDVSVSTQISKTGKTIPLLECSASFDDYLKGMDANSVRQLNDEANKAGRFPGLKIGDLDTPNNNAGNWE